MVHYRIGVLYGDGIGPEIVQATVDVISTAANPIGEMLSTVMLFDWLSNRHRDMKLFEVGQVVQSAIQELLIEGICTPDLGGSATTSEFTQSIIHRIKS